MKSTQLRQIIKEELVKFLSEAEDYDYSYNIGDDPEYKGHKVDPKYRSSSYLFTVRNDDIGRERIAKVKDALGPLFRFRIRGRHHDRKEVLGTEYRPGRQNDIPPDKAEFLAVYVDPK